LKWKGKVTGGGGGWGLRKGGGNVAGEIDKLILHDLKANSGAGVVKIPAQGQNCWRGGEKVRSNKE